MRRDLRPNFDHPILDRQRKFGFQKIEICRVLWSWFPSANDKQANTKIARVSMVICVLEDLTQRLADHRARPHVRLDLKKENFLSCLDTYIDEVSFPADISVREFQAQLLHKLL